MWILTFFELRIENWVLVYSMKIWIVNPTIFGNMNQVKKDSCESRFSQEICHWELRIENWELRIENWVLRIEYWYLLYSMKIENWELSIENWIVISFIFNENWELRIEYWELRIENWELRIEYWYLLYSMKIENWELRIGIFYISMKIWIVKVETILFPKIGWLILQFLEIGICEERFLWIVTFFMGNWELNIGIFYIQWKFGT